MFLSLSLSSLILLSVTCRLSLYFKNKRPEKWICILVSGQREGMARLNLGGPSFSRPILYPSSSLSDIYGYICILVVQSTRGRGRECTRIGKCCWKLETLHSVRLISLSSFHLHLILSILLLRLSISVAISSFLANTRVPLPLLLSVFPFSFS